VKFRRFASRENVTTFK